VEGEGRLGATGRASDGPGRMQPVAAGDQTDAVAACVVLLARALDLEKVALFLDDGAGRPLRCVGRHGPVALERLARGGDPPGGPWSASIAVEHGGRTAGVLLVSRAGGVALTAADQALARRLGEGAVAILATAGLAADLVHARELLARADRLSALGTLAAGVAHEIRNPLVSVRTFIQLLPERVEDEEFRTTFRELALGEIERICELITDLLAFSRPTPVEREATDLNQIASQIVRLLEPEARKRDVGMSTAFADVLPPVIVHDAQVKQVLMNIVLNAIQACPARGTVAVGTRGEAAGTCAVEITDSGVGIPPEQLAHIFEPFFTTKDQGSGLGLYIAHRIVTDHGGTIDVAARAGGGTVFTIRFPIAREGSNGHER
jgi:signal transduction histidine kinase